MAHLDHSFRSEGGLGKEGLGSLCRSWNLTALNIVQVRSPQSTYFGVHTTHAQLERKDAMPSTITGQTRLPVGNKDFTNATVVIIGAGISGKSSTSEIVVYLANLTRRNVHGD